MLVLYFRFLVLELFELHIGTYGIKRNIKYRKKKLERTNYFRKKAPS